jgi:hypothetical protein
MHATTVLLLLAMTTTAFAEAPKITPNCDHDGWTCHDGFPALSRDGLTIVNIIGVGDKLIAQHISVASSRVLETHLVFVGRAGETKNGDRAAAVQRSVADFRPMQLVKQQATRYIYRTGTVELTLDECVGDPCATTYRVRRRRR